MNLKEAFRYQNYLDKALDAINLYLNIKGNVVEVEELHKRSLANPEAEDETIDATAERDYPATTDQLVEIMKMLIAEKAGCARAITTAKVSYLEATGFDLDAELSVNRHRQTAARTMKHLGSIKEMKTVSKGTGYKFNAEGVQAPYYYDVEHCSKPTYDTRNAKKIGQEIADYADKISTDADICMIESVVDFNPRFRPTGTIADLVETAVGFITSV